MAFFQTWKEVDLQLPHPMLEVSHKIIKKSMTFNLFFVRIGSASFPTAGIRLKGQDERLNQSFKRHNIGA